MAVSPISSSAISGATVPPIPAPEAPVAPAGATTLRPGDVVELTGTTPDNPQTQAASTPVGEGTGRCGEGHHGRAARHAERRADRLIRAADKRLDRLAKRFDGDEEAQKSIDSLRSQFETQVRDATQAYVDGGGKDRDALRAQIRDARRELRSGNRELIKSRQTPPPAPTPPAADAPPSESPVADGAGAAGTASTTADIGGGPAAPETQPANPELAPATPTENDQPASPATTRLVLTYTSFQFTFSSTTDRVG